MPASAPLTAIRPRRGLLRGSVLGMGLLVVSSTSVSAALADEETEQAGTDLDDAQPVELSATAGPLVEDDEWTATSPAGLGVPTADFGNQKTLSIDLAPPGSAPSNLSLAGAVFDLVRSDGVIAAQCTTTHAGECKFWSSARWYIETPSASNAEVEAGYQYTLRQSRRSTGLALLPGDLGTVYFCGLGECNSGRYVSYTPVSLFFGVLGGSATEAASGAALPGTTFALSGPGYPRTDGTVAPAAVDRGQATSDDDGELSWTGWFLPGDYTVSAVADGDGPLSGEPAGLTLADWKPFQEGRPSVDIALRYVRPVVVVPEDESDGGTGGDSGAPANGGSEGGATGSAGAPSSVSPATEKPATGSPATGKPATGSPARPGAVEEKPAAVGDPSAGVAPGGSAPESPRKPSAVPAALEAVMGDGDAGPTSVPAPTTGAPRTVAPPSASGPITVAPRLETASSEMSELEAVGLGALLLAAVGAGFLLLRMRRRNRDV